MSSNFRFLAAAMRLPPVHMTDSTNHDCQPGTAAPPASAYPSPIHQTPTRDPHPCPATPLQPLPQAKAYTTRVGAGPYPTEIHGKLAEDLRAVGHEYGTTTGRPRRIGWMDIVALRYACKINGVTHINLTKLDVLDNLEEIQVGVGYK